MKIHIFYRHYNISGSSDTRGGIRPEWFDFEKCFLNLLNTIKNKNVDLHVVMDGDYQSNFIKKYEDYYTIHPIYVGAEMLSFFKTWEIAKSTNIGDNDLIYFLENDYLHLDNWVETVIELFQSFEYLNYVSLYDHNDKYISDHYEDLFSKIIVTKSHHWRTTPSTCGSFIVNKKIFNEDYDIQSTYDGDHYKFLHLSEIRQRHVITPIPALSTHCVNGLMSPTINWQYINSKIL